MNGMTETLLGEKLRRGGFIPREVRFSIAIAEFLNNGGTIDRAYELIAVAADKMGSEAELDLPKVRLHAASASRTDAAKGPNGSADKADPALPDAAPERSGGQTSDADKARCSLPSASPRKPGHAKRGASAIAAVQATVAKSLFDTTKLPDGRTLREVHWSEVPALASRYTFLSRVMLAIHNRGVPADPAATLDALVTEDELKLIVETVERTNDIH